MDVFMVWYFVKHRENLPLHLPYCTRVKLGLLLQGKNSLSVFGNRMLRRMFGPKREEMAEGWKKLHNDELHNLYSSADINRWIRSRKMRCWNM
jgi:hypothetical protein